MKITTFAKAYSTFVLTALMVVHITMVTPMLISSSSDFLVCSAILILPVCSYLYVTLILKLWRKNEKLS